MIAAIKEFCTKSGQKVPRNHSELIRCIFESLALKYKNVLDKFRSLAPFPIERLHIIGGGAKGMLWRQIVADILGLELQKVRVDDSSFGTAMLTAVGIGWFDSFAHAAEACVEIDSVSRPDPATHELYEKLFLKYKAVHDALAPIYRG